MARTATKWHTAGKIISIEAVTPSDAVDNNYDSLFIGTGGDLAVKALNDSSAATFKNIGDGEFVPVCVKNVMSTNTTATDILGLVVERG